VVIAEAAADHVQRIESGLRCASGLVGLRANTANGNADLGIDAPLASLTPDGTGLAKNGNPLHSASTVVCLH
jgi:hypothetical protein